jgi:glycosyltransferase involved in cell wall biosynthesis
MVSRAQGRLQSLMLSVVMPSKNQGRFISAALESVVQQHRNDNLEILVRDCESEDQTPSILAEYADLPFVHITRESDQGQTDAINKGFQGASGDILCWLNSDDVMHPHAVDRVLEAFRNHPEADVVFGDAVFIDERGVTVRRFPTADPHLSKLRNRCVLSQPSVFFRKEPYLAVGGLNTKRHYCMDYELWTRFALNRCIFVRTAHVLSATRLHGETKTFNGGLAFIEEICDMQEALLGDASPVWRIYEHARSPDLQRFRSKLLRFLMATLKQSARQPSSLPLMAVASIERTTSELAARVRHARAT